MQIFSDGNRQFSPSPLFILVLLFLMLLAFRMYVNIGTLRPDYTENVFRVGIVPWSDAKAWVNGAIQVINGEPISGVATARPLYPLFLAVLFFILGHFYMGVIYAQMVLSAIVVVIAYYLLKPVPNRLGVLLFLCFLSIWRPDVSTVFMTENLGIYILILCFALMWRGLSIGCEKTTISGAFLLGLSQAVRPWCVMTLITVPFFSFVSNKPLKDKFRSFILHTLFIVLGFGLHPMAAGIFNKPGEGYANNPQTLYGQVVGGKGWTAVYGDPIIKKALEQNLTSKEVNGIIYRRIKALFLENPGQLLKATIKGYRYYFEKIPDEFGKAGSRPVFFALFFFMQIFLDKHLHLHSLIRKFKRRPAACAVSVIGVAVFFLNFSWLWTVLLVVGIIPPILNPKNRFYAFILLYLTGIMLSIPLVGTDGGMRVKIGSDILLFLIASTGLSWVIEKKESAAPDAKAASDYPITYGLNAYQVFSILLGAATLFWGIPYIVNHVSTRSYPLDAELRHYKPEDLAARLNLAEIPISPGHLNALWHEWPELTLEKENGKMAYYSIRYTIHDAVFLNSHEGIECMIPAIAARHWPLMPLRMKRTVMVLETWYTLFPNVTPKDLTRFENREIIVVGMLISKPRRFLYATPFVLYVSHIVSIDDTGALEVMAM
ncbi:MAG: hypothetical protein C4530_13140 [Desulfobacteraceae bacterium]|nr:MAG: hypothetical protein C4530_13140 [Desulfobacteraceae bacterium]